MFKRVAVLLVSSVVVLAGCGTDPRTENEEIISNLIEAGFPADDIMVSDGNVYVGRDAHVTLDASREMLQPGKESLEQYRTTNVVGSGVSKICLIPTTTFNSYSNLSAGLDMAIARWNSQGLRITFQRGGTGCTATISVRTTTGAGGSSGFPSGGLPYNTINIGTGMNSYSIGCIAHVIMHELGHAVGLRHSDYYDRSISCGGSYANEGASTVGAILIPGTPSTATVGGSVMNSCFRSTETGNWTSSDITTLNYLY